MIHNKTVIYDTAILPTKLNCDVDRLTKNGLEQNYKNTIEINLAFSDSDSEGLTSKEISLMRTGTTRAQTLYRFGLATSQPHESRS